MWEKMGSVSGGRVSVGREMFNVEGEESQCGRGSMSMGRSYQKFRMSDMCESLPSLGIIAVPKLAVFTFTHVSIATQFDIHIWPENITLRPLVGRLHSLRGNLKYKIKSKNITSM